MLQPWLIAIIIILIVALLILVVNLSIRAHRRQVSVGREELVGKVAVVRTTMDPKGTVFIDGELWVAILEGGQAQPGEEVIVIKSDGLKLRVSKD